MWWLLRQIAFIPKRQWKLKSLSFSILIKLAYCAVIINFKAFFSFIMITWKDKNKNFHSAFLYDLQFVMKKKTFSFWTKNIFLVNLELTSSSSFLSSAIVEAFLPSSATASLLESLAAFAELSWMIFNSSLLLSSSCCSTFPFAISALPTFSDNGVVSTKCNYLAK